MPTPYDNLRLTNSRYVPQYHGAPIEEFGNLLKKREQDYISNVDKEDIITSALSQAKVRDEDAGVKQDLIDKANKVTSEIAGLGGAYEFAGRKMRGLAREVLNDERLIQATERYQTDEASKTDLKKRRASGHLSEAGYYLAMQSINNDYKGLGEKNEAGFYDSPTYYDPMRNIDIDQEIRQRVSAIRAKQSTTGWQPDDSVEKNPALVNKTTTEIKQWEVNQAIDALLQEGDNASFLDEQAKYNTAKGDEGGDSRDKLVSQYKKSYRSSAGVFGSSEQHKWIPKEKIKEIKQESASERRLRLKTEKEAYDAEHPFEDTGMEVKITTAPREELSSYQGNIDRIEGFNKVREELKPIAAQTQEAIKEKSLELDGIPDTPQNEQRRFDLKRELDVENQKAQHQENTLRTMDNEQRTIETLHEQALMSTASEMFNVDGATNFDIDQSMVSVAESMAGSQEDIDKAIDKTITQAQHVWRRNAMPTKHMTPEEIEARESGALSNRDYLNLYGKRNYEVNMDNKTIDAFQENLNQLTDGILVNQPIINWKESKVYEEAFTNMLIGDGISVNGMKNGVRVPMGDISMQLDNYSADDMTPILPEEQSLYGDIMLSGITVRNNNIAFVGTTKKQNPNGEGSLATQVTWGSEAKTNAWLNKYPQLKPMYAGLGALEKSMASPGAEVPIDVSVIDPKGRPTINIGEEVINQATGKPYYDEEGNIKPRIIALVPYVISSPVSVPSGEDYLEHTLFYKGTVMSSPIEEEQGTSLGEDQMDLVLTKNDVFKKLPKSSATQSRIVEVLANVREALLRDEAKRQEDAYNAGINVQ